MPIKVNIKFTAKNLVKNIKGDFGRQIRSDITSRITEDILQGKSPVRSHTFKKYSEKYAVKKKGERPVDMFKTGKMLKSIRAVLLLDGSISVFFRDKKAAWHQEGQGFLPIRLLLPVTRGSKFNINITNFIIKTLNNAARKETRRQK